MKKWMILLAALAAGLWATDLAFRFNPQRRNTYWLSGMASSPAYSDESPNPVFPDGRTARLPPAGTVARDFAPLPVEAGSDQAMREAGQRLKNPYSASDRAALARGQAIYDRVCILCHGATAAGNGVVVRHGFPPPPSLLADHARDMPDGAIFYKITAGGPIMPSFAAQITRADRWKCVLYVRRLQARAPHPRAAAAGVPAGEALMRKSDCFGCHALDSRLVGPSLRDIARRYAGKPAVLGVLVKKVRAGGAGNWGQIPMAPHPALSDAQLGRMVSWILSLSKGAAAPSKIPSTPGASHE